VQFALQRLGAGIQEVADKVGLATLPCYPLKVDLYGFHQAQDFAVYGNLVLGHPLSFLAMLVYLYIYQREGGLSCFNPIPFLHYYIGYYSSKEHLQF
jgi:hypothetical protein